MYRKLLLGGVTAAAIVGAGGTALAVTGSDGKAGPRAASSASSASSPHGKHAKQRRELRRALRRVAHAQVTVKGKDGKFVTHDVITGTVTSVSTTSIIVKAADNKTERYAVTSSTKVFQRQVKTGTKAPGGQRHRPTKSGISEVAAGDHVFVAGTGITSMRANRVLDIKR